ncbi:MAG: hypothetical protein EZS28_052767, partial [Streblomastix strix]
NLLFAYLLRIPGGILSEEVAREIIVISEQRKLMNKSEQQDVKMADIESAQTNDNKQAKIDELAKAFLLLPRENRGTFQILLELMHDIAVTPRSDQQQQQQQQMDQSTENKEHDHTAHITTPLAVASFFIPHISHTHPIITTNKLPQSTPQLVDALAFSIENYEEIWESIIKQSSGSKSGSGLFANRIELKKIPILHQMLNKLIRHSQSPSNLYPIELLIWHIPTPIFLQQVSIPSYGVLCLLKLCVQNASGYQRRNMLLSKLLTSMQSNYCRYS